MTCSNLLIHTTTANEWPLRQRSHTYVDIDVDVWG